MDSSSFAYVDKAKSDLKAAKRVLNEEIDAYPTPIAGCDEQFNYLLQQKRRVLGALQALDADIHIPTPRSL